MEKLFLALIIGGIMAATVGAYAATLGGTTSAESIGSSGDIQVNAPGVGDVSFEWEMDRDNTSPHFGKLTGLTLAVQNAPGVGSAYDVLVRLEDGNSNLVGGATSTISDGDTSTTMSFDDELDPKDIENAIVVIDEG